VNEKEIGAIVVGFWTTVRRSNTLFILPSQKRHLSMMEQLALSMQTRRLRVANSVSMRQVHLQLLLLLLAGLLASVSAGAGRKLLAPVGTLRFSLGDYAGGAAKFLADVDKTNPGKLNRIMRNSGVLSVKELVQQLNTDGDM
jgi:hypothetical protein